MAHTRRLDRSRQGLSPALVIASPGQTLPFLLTRVALYDAGRTTHYYGTTVTTADQAERMRAVATLVHEHIVTFDPELEQVFARLMTNPVLLPHTVGYNYVKDFDTPGVENLHALIANSIKRPLWKPAVHPVFERGSRSGNRVFEHRRQPN